MSVYSRPSEYSYVLEKVTSGTVLTVEISDDYPEWYSTGSRDDGWVLRSQVVLYPQETLFRIVSALPKSGKVKVRIQDYATETYSTCTYSKFLQQYDAMLDELQDPDDEGGDDEEEEDSYTDYELNKGPVIESSLHKVTAAKADECYLYIHDALWTVSHECTYPLRDAAVKRERTGDKRTLGLVVASEAKNRVNLRKKDSKSSASLGKYYTGTQVEILGTAGDWYHVKVNGLDEGYMMKQYVMIVEQE